MDASLLSFLNSSSYSSFTQRLEKHITDYKRGQGNLSNDVAFELGVRTFAASDLLARTNPAATRAYSGYLTGFSYDKRARFSSAIEHSQELINRIATPRPASQPRKTATPTGLLLDQLI